MTDFDHIVYCLTPNDLLQVGLELPNRRKSQHTLGFLLALCTLGFDAQVGQAGIGGVDQVIRSDRFWVIGNSDCRTSASACYLEAKPECGFIWKAY